MKCAKQRKEGRYPVRMKMVSRMLPHLSADLVDLSASGAKVRFPKSMVPVRAGATIPFGARLANQLSSAFEGIARIAWVNETLDGIEAGLEWETISENAVERIKLALIGTAA